MVFFFGKELPSTADLFQLKSIKLRMVFFTDAFDGCIYLFLGGPVFNKSQGAVHQFQLCVSQCGRSRRGICW